MPTEHELLRDLTVWRCSVDAELSWIQRQLEELAADVRALVKKVDDDR